MPLVIGDRVRVVSGEHQGRLGVVANHEDEQTFIIRALRPSPIRDVLLARFDVPLGSYAVRLDAGRTVVFKEKALRPWVSLTT